MKRLLILMLLLAAASAYADNDELQKYREDIAASRTDLKPENGGFVEAYARNKALFAIARKTGNNIVVDKNSVSVNPDGSINVASPVFQGPVRGNVNIIVEPGAIGDVVAIGNHGPK